jgi:cyclophilin family peptidyl-prolyl cis-trans isomerase
VHFDRQASIALKGDRVGRVELETFDDLAPKTAANFRALCSGKNPEHLSYRGNVFHRIIPGFMAQVLWPSPKFANTPSGGMSFFASDVVAWA